MKAISLWQPWASLVAIGAKRFETRSWAPPKGLLGQRIAIHSAKAPKSVTLRHVSREVKHEMGEAFYRSDLSMSELAGGLPRGAIVCTAELAAFWPITPQSDGRTTLSPDFNGDLSRLVLFTPDCFGDYSPSRWIWALNYVRRLEIPIPFKGRQGFFDVPDELIC